MENYTGKICPYCKTELKETDFVKVCPSCGIPHHVNCWNENQGCTTFGCPQKADAPQPQVAPQPQAAPMSVCSHCGAPMADGQAFCPQCGTPKAAAPQKTFCSKCGTELQNGQGFCPNCGQKAGLAVDPNVNAAINQFNAGIQPPAKKKNKTWLIVVGVIVGIIILIAALGGGDSGSGGSGGGAPTKKGPDFHKMYTTYCNSIWASVGSDGSYLSIDTNPYDRDDDGLAYPAAYEAIKKVNSALGLPESVITEMGETSSLDGKQTLTFESQGVIVSWKYHPDKGLEVTYKTIN